MEEATPPSNPPQPQPKNAKLTWLIIAAVVLGLIVVLLAVRQHNSKSTTMASTAPSNPPAVSSKQAAVQITAQGFVPATLTVKAGTVVTWQNADNTLHQIASNPYPADNGLPGLASKGLESGQSYSYTFKQTGKFGYHDQQNPTKLLGQINVTK